MTEVHRLTRPDGSRLALFRQAPWSPSRQSVLVVHGATFPTSLSAAYRIDGRSWFDELCAAGFETWGLDFQGYGASDRFPEGDYATPPGGALDAAAQIALALDFIRRRSPEASLSLIAHSWGTAPAGLLLSRNPRAVDRAVFYGPIVASETMEPLPENAPPFIEVSGDAQWAAFSAAVPEGPEPPMGRAEFERWLEKYGGRVPTGAAFDIERARRGVLPYDPGTIDTPMLVVRGSWDVVTTEADSIRFFHSLPASPRKRLTWLH
ncbi:MAG TPA: alpha/beta fold hydrolase, partial [Usitatibacter sp.]|nr:alpha/beta fold hydrolase [Usitatibacter sp.]